ncbi:MAG: ABC transporter ATP-binding protein [Proteobacteria bacterium]|nr:ABC transporter ATP-binding protein [Pseudomonadota bacterium]MDE3208304.1 ABC transporter ATP-binding protein [Pseudomonadota bacterium]
MNLEIRDGVISVGGSLFFQNLNLKFNPCALTAVMGRNGSGKTSLLQVLAGLVKPMAGMVGLDGVDLQTIAPRERARLIGVLVQHEPEAFYGTVRDYVGLARIPWTNGWKFTSKDKQAVTESLYLLDLDSLADESFHYLSAGEKQRVRIAQLLAQETQMLLLDEPLQNLDIDYQGRVMDMLGLQARSGKVVLCVLHDIYWVQSSCDQALLLFDDRQARMGQVKDIVTPFDLQLLYGVEFVSVNAGDTWLVPQK